MTCPRFVNFVTFVLCVLVTFRRASFQGVKLLPTEKWGAILFLAPDATNPIYAPDKIKLTRLADVCFTAFHYRSTICSKCCALTPKFTRIGSHLILCYSYVNNVKIVTSSSTISNAHKDIHCTCFDVIRVTLTNCNGALTWVNNKKAMVSLPRKW